MEAARIPWRTLGELFVQRGLITHDDLESALSEQAQTDKRLGEILVERGLVSAPDLRQALMEQLGVEISEESFGSSLWAEIKRRHEGGETDEESDLELESELEPESEAAAPDPPVLELAAAPEELPVPLAAHRDDVDVDETEKAMLRAELEQARAELEQLREMLADSMTALRALMDEGTAPPAQPDESSY